jgi:hypothetical protein
LAEERAGVIETSPYLSEREKVRLETTFLSQNVRCSKTAT